MLPLGQRNEYSYIFNYFADFIIRSHEVKDEGYEVAHNGQCITVFSAPNYWYVTLLCYCIILVWTVDARSMNVLLLSIEVHLL